MITQRMQTYVSLMNFDSFMVFIRLFRCKKILKGSLQPKLKGASVWSFNACSKVPTGWSCHTWSLYWYCKEKNISMSTAVISRAIFTCPGQAGPVFRLDHSPVPSSSGQFVRVHCPVMVTNQPTSTNELVHSLLMYYLMPDRLKSDVHVHYCGRICAWAVDRLMLTRRLSRRFLVPPLPFSQVLFQTGLSYLLLVVDGWRSSVDFNCPILCLGDSWRCWLYLLRRHGPAVCSNVRWHVDWRIFVELRVCSVRWLVWSNAL